MPVSERARRRRVIRLGFGLGAVALILLVSLLVLSGPRPAVKRAVSTTASVSSHATKLAKDQAIATVGADPSANQTFVHTLPEQFENTAVDGEITVNHDGMLVPSRAIRDLFDYFLTGIGHYRGLDQQQAARQSLARYAVKQPVNGEARSDLLDLFDDYVRLKNRLAEESKSFASVDFKTRLALMRDMRRAELGSVAADAFYSDTESASATLTQSAAPDAGVPTDPTLAAAQTIAEAKAKGASTSEIQRMRVDAFGSRAAERLSTLDDRRQDWRRRYADYAEERDAIKTSGLAPADKRAALASLRSQRFDSPGQRKRAAALDRIAARTTP